MLACLASVHVAYAGGNKERSRIQADFEGLVNVDLSGFETGRPGGSFTVSTTLASPDTFNPIFVRNEATHLVIDRVFAGLVRRNQMTLEYEPYLAAGWTVSEDQTTITFTLREGLTWSDGKPLTAEDFLYARELAFMEGVDGDTRDLFFVGETPAEMETVDKSTLKIVLPRPYAGGMKMATMFPVPKHIFEPVVNESGIEGLRELWSVDTDPTSVVGCGPFLIDSYEEGEEIVFRPNPLYHEKDEKGQRLPYIDQLVVVYSEDEVREMERFLAGELDYLEFRGNEHEALMQRKEELAIELYNAGPADDLSFVAFNQNPIQGPEDRGVLHPQISWLREHDFRRAIAHLIDRKGIIQTVESGFGYPQFSFVPRYSPYHWRKISEKAHKYDPEKAKQLLDDLDYVDSNDDGFREDVDGNKLTLTLVTNSGNSARETIAQMLVQEAAAIGIEIIFESVEYEDLVEKIGTSYDWELAILGLTDSIDPVHLSNVFPSSGNLHLIEPGREEPRREWEQRVDKAWDKANLTLDEGQRKSGFQTVQQIWIEELPWVYTYAPAYLVAGKSRWANFTPQPADGYRWEGFVHAVYQKED